MGGGNSDLLTVNAGLWEGLFLGLNFSVMVYYIIHISLINTFYATREDKAVLCY